MILGKMPQIHWGKLLLFSAYPEMANLPDIGVAQKIESSEYQPYASGSIFCAP
jgi:hypothetical protein